MNINTNTSFNRVPNGPRYEVARPAGHAVKRVVKVVDRSAIHDTTPGSTG